MSGEFRGEERPELTLFGFRGSLWRRCGKQAGVAGTETDQAGSCCGNPVEAGE